MRFLKFSFYEIYGDEVADEMVDLVRKTMDRLYDYYSCVDSPNVAIPSESERTHIEGDKIGCTDLYAMVNSRYECFLKAKKSIGTTRKMSYCGGCENCRYMSHIATCFWPAVVH